MRSRWRYLLLAAALGAAVAVPAALAVVEVNPPITAVNAGLYSHYWSPAQATIATGGTVTLSNSTEVPHGVHWISTPATPVCEEGAGKVPVGTTSASSGTKWSGKCTFSQVGTYTFYCTVHGPEMTGTITVEIPEAPVVTAEAASAVGQTEATLNGTVNPEGKATEYFFEWGTTTSYGHTTEKLSLGSVDHTAHAVSAKVTGLAPGAPYHFRLVAKNEAATTPGADRSFSTEAAPGAPSVTTGAASGVGETEATLNATVNPDGQATEYFFEWGPTSGYGHSTERLPLGSVDHTGHAVSAKLTGLAAGVEYHFRVLAQNASVVMPLPGADRTFTASSPPHEEQPPHEQPSSKPPPTATQSSSTTTPTPSATPSAETSNAPLIELGSASRSTQRGGSVTGALEVSAAGAGGHLEIDLLARRSSLGKGRRSPTVRVGRLLRSSVSPGKVPFAVKLDAVARHALKRLRHLSLTVRITLTPTHGRTATITYGVQLRG